MGSSLDSIGTMAYSVRDLASLAEILSGQDPKDVTADIDQFRPYFDKSVDKTLRLTIEMGMMGNGNMRHGNMMGDTRTDGIEWEDDNAMNISAHFARSASRPTN
jgi:Asp-tRNA(Asn)/Glu-tRNA(Gln) amidotransferase A subunit family amidase